MINSKDGRLRIVRSNITRDAKLDKLSLISNKIFIKNSKLNTNELDFNLLISSESKKIYPEHDIIKDGYNIFHTRTREDIILNRKPSELYISADSEVTARNVNINLLESKFINKGLIHGWENVSITSEKQNEGKTTIVKNGDIVSMNNTGTIKGQNIKIVANNQSHMENNGSINATKNMVVKLYGSTFVNKGNIDNYGSYGNKDTTITFDHGTFKNDGEMKVSNLHITNNAGGKYINNGSFYFTYYNFIDFSEHNPDNSPMHPFKFDNNKKSNNSDHDTNDVF